MNLSNVLGPRAADVLRALETAGFAVVPAQATAAQRLAGYRPTDRAGAYEAMVEAGRVRA